MTWFDYVVLGVMAISQILGGWRGFVSELLALVAWVVAFLVARWFGPTLIPMLPASLTEPLLRTLVGYSSVFLVALLLLSLLRWLLREMLKAAGLGVVDRVLGAAFGVVRGLAIVLLGVAAAGMTKMPRQVWWQDAMLAPPLETMVLALEPWMPQDVAKRIRFK